MKRPLNHHDLEKVKKELLELQNAANLPLLSDDYQEVKVAIRPCSDVTPAMFKQDPLNPNGHIAHPDTIKAMRKDIFVAGEGFEDLQKEITCRSCKKIYDIQFWIHCPYCGEKIPPLSDLE